MVKVKGGEMDRDERRRKQNEDVEPTAMNSTCACRKTNYDYLFNQPN
jgi:hypothetical protein